MTDEMMSLRTLLEKSSDADLLREMVGFAAQRLFEGDLGFFKPVETEQRNPMDATEFRVPLAMLGFFLHFQPLRCRGKSRSILSLPASASAK